MPMIELISFILDKFILDFSLFKLLDDEVLISLVFKSFFHIHNLK